MENAKYVKLRDKGTIFFDASQDVSVTGELPAAVKLTKKVQDAIRIGTLIEVDADEAKKLIATASKDADAVKKAYATKDGAALKEAKAAANAEAKRAIAAEEELALAEDKLVEFDSLTERAETAEASLAKLQPYIKGLQTQISNLKAGKEAGEDLVNPLEEPAK